MGVAAAALPRAWGWAVADDLADLLGRNSVDRPGGFQDTLASTRMALRGDFYVSLPMPVFGAAHELAGPILRTRAKSSHLNLSFG